MSKTTTYNGYVVKEDEPWMLADLTLFKYCSCKCSTSVLKEMILKSEHITVDGKYKKIIHGTVYDLNIKQKKIGPGVWFVELEQVAVLPPKDF